MAKKKNREGYLDLTAYLALKNIEKEERKEMKAMSDFSVKRGDIFYIYKYNDTMGSEQQSGRPAVIVSNNIGNETSDTVEIVYCTTKPKNDLPTHVLVRSTNQISTVICEQVTTVSKERLGDYVGSCFDEEMANIDIAICISLGLNISEKKEVKKPKEAFKAPETDRVSDSVLNTEIASLNEAIIRSNVERDTYKKLYEDLVSKMIAR